MALAVINYYHQPAHFIAGSAVILNQLSRQASLSRPARLRAASVAFFFYEERDLWRIIQRFLSITSLRNSPFSLCQIRAGNHTGQQRTSSTIDRRRTIISTTLGFSM